MLPQEQDMGQARPILHDDTLIAICFMLDRW